MDQEPGKLLSTPTRTIGLMCYTVFLTVSTHVCVLSLLWYLITVEEILPGNLLFVFALPFVAMAAACAVFVAVCSRYRFLQRMTDLVFKVVVVPLLIITTFAVNGYFVREFSTWG
ncbi:hypothetical protein [Rubinisphaera margarita]|uniref:hypothetical protein n=1 Tax=Rubinisphaera margarita TaxID=2909586 RepID=UPI001EE994C4|nr:hypothetical protein [Rubinisphaera margarita]MCG6155498.1 hypothetical protein [Rubinisphaera margarita]